MRFDTQAATLRETVLRRAVPWSTAAVRPATLTALHHAHGSGYSREFLRESVLAWAAREWPELFIGRSACEPTFESRSERLQVRVTCSCAGGYRWSFEGIRPDADGSRHWETRVLVLGDDEHDLIGVSTGYLGDVDAKVQAGQPDFLNRLVEHLPFEDGGYPICAVPRQVFDERAFVNLQDHLLSERRALPILIVGSGSSSSESRIWEEPLRVDALSMAKQLCGLAHVVCLGPLVLDLLASRLGSAMDLGAGEVRLCLPPEGGPGREQNRHGARKLPQTRRFFSGDVAATARAATHAWSVSPRRRTEFNILWTAIVGA